MILKPLRPEFFRTDMGDYVLSVRDLRARGARTAAAVDIKRGGVAVLAGDDASKALACLAGFLPAHGGSVRYIGYEIVRRSRTQRVRNGIVLAGEPRPFARMSVLENVMVGAFVRTRDPQRARAAAREVLALFELERFADRAPAELGPRDAKRLEIARALATKPLLLLVDRAFGGPDGPALTPALTAAIAARGTTLLVAEADAHAVPEGMTLARM
jgi:ABC-type branched-subunit amino acid transport system ATPase component